MGAALDELWHALGPGFSGALFAAGWWIWVDAAVCSKAVIEFVHYLPGILASFGAVMLNGVRREELQEYSPYDDGAGCRSRTWLFVSYVISFVSLASAVGMLIKDTATVPADPTKAVAAWTGFAGIVQCFLVLGSGLVFWTSRSAADYY